MFLTITAVIKHYIVCICEKHLPNAKTLDYFFAKPIFKNCHCFCQLQKLCSNTNLKLNLTETCHLIIAPKTEQH